MAWGAALPIVRMHACDFESVARMGGASRARAVSQHVPRPTPLIIRPARPPQDGLCPLNARVVLCATVSPLADDLEPTKSTLSFARNVRNVRSFAKINQAKPEPGMQHALLLKQAAQLQQLRAQVAQLQQDAADMQERLETVPELEAGKADAEGAVQRMQADLTVRAHAGCAFVCACACGVERQWARLGGPTC